MNDNAAGRECTLVFAARKKNALFIHTDEAEE
jgi:hypothetical protein